MKVTGVVTGTLESRHSALLLWLALIAVLVVPAGAESGHGHLPGSSAAMVATRDGSPRPWLLNPAGDRLLLNRPMGLGFDTGGTLVVADLLNRRLRFFAPGKDIPEKRVIRCDFTMPWALSIDEKDRIYVTDTGRNAVQVLDHDGKPLAVLGGKGSAPGRFLIPAGIAVDESRQRLLVADFANHVIQVLALNGTFLDHIGAVNGTGSFGRCGRREGVFRGPADVAVDGQGRIYVADKENCRIQVFHPNGGFIASFGRAGASPGNFDRPAGIAVDDGMVFVCDTFNDRVQVFLSPFTSALEPRLRLVKVLDGRGLPGGPLKLPNKCAVSPGGDLYVSDTGNNRIVVFPRALFQEALATGPGPDALR